MRLNCFFAAVLIVLAAGVGESFAQVEWPQIEISSGVKRCEVIAIAEIERIEVIGRAPFTNRSVDNIEVFSKVLVPFKGESAAGSELRFRHRAYTEGKKLNRQHENYITFVPGERYLLFLRKRKDGEMFFAAPGGQIVTFSEEEVSKLRGIREGEPLDDYLLDILIEKFLAEGDFADSCYVMWSKLFRKRVKKDEALLRKVVRRALWLGLELEDTDLDSHMILQGNLERLDERSRPYIFLDAVGEVIADADVKVPGKRLEDGKRSMRIFRTDESGFVTVPREKFGRGPGSVGVSAAGYGTAFAKRYRWPVIHFPLVAEESEAAGDAVWGNIVDEANEPVAGAQIWIQSLTTPGLSDLNEKFNDWMSSDCWVVSDVNGFFRTHARIPLLQEKLSSVPVNWQYRLIILKPDDPNFQSVGRMVPAGHECRIVMKRIGGVFHRFSFEDANGLIVDPNILKHINITIKLHEGGGFSVKYRDFARGGNFPFGTYTAYGAEVRFEPIEVVGSSPEELVFPPVAAKSIRYSGQVFYGFSDKPAEGAFVVCSKGPGTDGRVSLQTLSTEQWNLLHGASSKPSVDDPAVEVLHKIWSIADVTRTDSSGYFEIVVPDSGRNYDFCVFDAGYIGICHESSYFEPDAQNHVELPFSRLFPATKVIFRPYIEGKAVRLRASWVFDFEENPGWVCEMISYTGRNEPRQYQIRFDYGEYVTEFTRAIYVPAGAKTQILLMPPHDQCYVVMPNVIEGKQGEVIDLGRYDFEEEMPIYVEVTDGGGAVLEGVVVRHWMGQAPYCGMGQYKVTDSEGMAEFSVPLHYKGRFAVQGRIADKHNRRMVEWLNYETNGEDDRGRVYTLKLSDEMVRRLFE